MTEPHDYAALVERLRELFKKATPGDLNTAQRHVFSEYVECPMCAGDGEVEATDYCNFDGVALGVQFYGIGSEFGAHENLWRELVKSAPTLLDIITQQEAEIAAAYERGKIEGARLMQEAASMACDEEIATWLRVEKRGSISRTIDRTIRALSPEDVVRGEV